MDTSESFEDMLADLRQTFNKKIPGGLTDMADGRLNRTLSHYIKEVHRVQPQPSKQDILRLSYDSMANWFRRNLTQTPPERFESEVDPATLFASLKKPEAPAPAPFRMPDLEPVETKRLSPSTVQQKDALQPQEDVVKYREVEYNLVMNSKDRDWLHNITQNRYNFVIQFNTNYKPQGYGLQAHINARLRNVTRIEFIKAILPVEGLNVILPKDCSGSAATQPQNAFYSVLALPSVNIMVDEFQGNNYGTDNNIDKSLAVCQYDATWRSETVCNKPGVNRGYSLFFPKFMKAQRVYSPTPLSNLQTLSFKIQDPENNLLSTLPDSSVLKSIVFGANISGTCYSDVSSNYIFLQTQDWFPIWSYSQLDKLLLQGLTFASTSTPAAGVTLNQWLQDPAGHSIVSIAYTQNSATPFTVQEGGNDAGYANWIIIRNRFQDPVSGVVARDYFSGGANDNALASDLLNYPQTGGLLNLSRQVQLFIRIITREYDLVSSVRAENV